jgi:hypothetical protein
MDAGHPDITVYCTSNPLSSETIPRTLSLPEHSRAPWKKIALAAVAVIVTLYAATMGYFYHAMRQPAEQFGRVMMHLGPVPFLLFPFETMWKHARAGSLSIDAEAPDFSLPRLNGTDYVKLSTFRGQKPVVLVFGSYT